MKTTAIFSLLALSSPIVGTKDPREDQYCFLGCQETLSSQVFSDEPKTEDEGEGASSCGAGLRIQSILLCARKYCTRHQIDAGIKYASSSCDAEVDQFPNLDIVNHVSSQDIDHMKILAVGDMPGEINGTIIPSKDLFSLGQSTMSWWYGGRSSHLWYSKAMFIFWGIVVGMGVCLNAFQTIRFRFSGPFRLSPDGDSQKLQNTVIHRSWNAIRARFLLPATLDARVKVPGPLGSVPARAESTIICIYVVLNFILCAVSYTAFTGNLYWSSKETQIWRYFSDRTGYLSYANVAIFFVFGIRNNILLWLTGWEFTTFNHFHRWTARIATLEAVVHSIGYTVFDFRDGGYESYIQDFARRYWWTGTIATIVMCFMLALSVIWFRRRCYDLFLVAHICLALTTLVTLFYHTKIFNGEYDGFLWPCVAFWSFDRFCRIVRLAYFYSFGPRGKSMAEYSEEDNIIRIDVTDTFKKHKATGGVHYFLYSPLSLLAWQSHPFTLVRWREVSGSAAADTPTSSSPIEKDGKNEYGVTTRRLSASLEGDTRYSFLVRPFNGYTARLRRSLSRTSDAKAIHLLLEGPYGQNRNFQSFSDVVFLIGGSGISVGISLIYAALEQSPNANVKLVWACKTRPYINSIMSKELRSAQNSGRLIVNPFVTASSEKVDEGSQDNFRPGRPDLSEELARAIEGRSRSLAVVVCGPPSLADDGRAAFVEELKKGQRSIELFIESFGW